MSRQRRLPCSLDRYPINVEAFLHLDEDGHGSTRTELIGTRHHHQEPSTNGDIGIQATSAEALYTIQNVNTQTSPLSSIYYLTSARYSELFYMTTRLKAINPHPSIRSLYNCRKQFQVASLQTVIELGLAWFIHWKYPGLKWFQHPHQPRLANEHRELLFLFLNQHLKHISPSWYTIVQQEEDTPHLTPLECCLRWSYDVLPFVYYAYVCIYASNTIVPSTIGEAENESVHHVTPPFSPHILHQHGLRQRPRSLEAIYAGTMGSSDETTPAAGIEDVSSSFKHKGDVIITRSMKQVADAHILPCEHPGILDPSQLMSIATYETNRHVPMLTLSHARQRAKLELSQYMERYVSLCGVRPKRSQPTPSSSPQCRQSDTVQSEAQPGMSSPQRSRDSTIHASKPWFDAIKLQHTACTLSLYGTGTSPFTTDRIGMNAVDYCAMLNSTSSFRAIGHIMCCHFDSMPLLSYHGAFDYSNNIYCQLGYTHFSPCSQTKTATASHQDATYQHLTALYPSAVHLLTHPNADVVVKAFDCPNIIVNNMLDQPIVSKSKQQGSSPIHEHRETYAFFQDDAPSTTPPLPNSTIELMLIDCLQAHFRGVVRRYRTHNTDALRSDGSTPPGKNSSSVSPSAQLPSAVSPSTSLFPTPLYVRLLGDYLNSSRYRYWTALTLATSSNNYDITKALLDTGLVDPMMGGGCGYTPLVCAIKSAMRCWNVKLLPETSVKQDTHHPHSSGMPPSKGQRRPSVQQPDTDDVPSHHGYQNHRSNPSSEVHLETQTYPVIPIYKIGTLHSSAMQTQGRRDNTCIFRIITLLVAHPQVSIAIPRKFLAVLPPQGYIAIQKGLNARGVMEACLAVDTLSFVLSANSPQEYPLFEPVDRILDRYTPYLNKPNAQNTISCPSVASLDWVCESPQDQRGSPSPAPAPSTGLTSTYNQCYHEWTPIPQSNGAMTDTPILYPLTPPYPSHGSLALSLHGQALGHPPSSELMPTNIRPRSQFYLSWGLHDTFLVRFLRSWCSHPSKKEVYRMRRYNRQITGCDSMSMHRKSRSQTDVSTGDDQRVLLIEPATQYARGGTTGSHQMPPHSQGASSLIADSHTTTPPQLTSANTAAHQCSAPVSDEPTPLPIPILRLIGEFAFTMDLHTEIDPHTGIATFLGMPSASAFGHIPFSSLNSKHFEQLQPCHPTCSCHCHCVCSSTHLLTF